MLEVLTNAISSAFDWTSLFIGAIIFFSYTLSVLFDRDIHSILRQAHVWDAFLTLSLPVLVPIYAMFMGGKWAFSQIKMQKQSSEEGDAETTTCSMQPLRSKMRQVEAVGGRRHLIPSTTTQYTPNRHVK